MVSQPDPARVDSLSNPLPACPSTPNCVRRSVRFEVQADSLFSSARRALRRMRPAEETVVAPNRVASVHRVVFFLDDMEFQVDPLPGASVLHVRSASREGTWDLWVNRLRVWCFLRLVRREIAA